MSYDPCHHQDPPFFDEEYMVKLANKNMPKNTKLNKPACIINKFLREELSRMPRKTTPEESSYRSGIRTARSVANLQRGLFVKWKARRVLRRSAQSYKNRFGPLPPTLRQEAFIRGVAKSIEALD